MRPPCRAPRRRARRASRARVTRPPPAGPGARRARSRCRTRATRRQARAPDLAQLPLDPVARHARPGRLRHGEAEPRLAGLLVALEPVEREKPRRDRPAMPVDGVEVTGAGETILALHALGREPLAALRAAALENGTPGPRRHPGPEAVLALAPADVWLIGALHRSKTGARRAPGPSRSGQYTRIDRCRRLSTGAAAAESRGKCGRSRRRLTAFHTCGESCGERFFPANERTFTVDVRARNPH